MLKGGVINDHEKPENDIFPLTTNSPCPRTFLTPYLSPIFLAVMEGVLPLDGRLAIGVIGDRH